MMSLKQAEADALINMPKERTDNIERSAPSMGGKLTVSLNSSDKKEEFLLDVWQSSIELSKVRHQMRGRKVIPLVRVDLGGAPHRNPDGEEIGCPHIHIYREGYGDKWTTTLPAAAFQDPSNSQRVLNDFMRFCNVVVEPLFAYDLFS